MKIGIVDLDTSHFSPLVLEENGNATWLVSSVTSSEPQPFGYEDQSATSQCVTYDRLDRFQISSMKQLSTSTQNNLFRSTPNDRP